MALAQDELTQPARIVGLDPCKDRLERAHLPAEVTRAIDEVEALQLLLATAARLVGELDQQQALLWTEDWPRG